MDNSVNNNNVQEALHFHQNDEVAVQGKSNQNEILANVTLLLLAVAEHAHESHKAPKTTTSRPLLTSSHPKSDSSKSENANNLLKEIQHYLDLLNQTNGLDPTILLGLFQKLAALADCLDSLSASGKKQLNDLLTSGTVAGELGELIADAAQGNGFKQFPGKAKAVKAAQDALAALKKTAEDHENSGNALLDALFSAAAINAGILSGSAPDDWHTKKVTEGYTQDEMIWDAMFKLADFIGDGNLKKGLQAYKSDYVENLMTKYKGKPGELLQMLLLYLLTGSIPDQEDHIEGESSVEDILSKAQNLLAEIQKDLNSFKNSGWDPFYDDSGHLKPGHDNNIGTKKKPNPITKDEIANAKQIMNDFKKIKKIFTLPVFTLSTKGQVDSNIQNITDTNAKTTTGDHKVINFDKTIGDYGTDATFTAGDADTKKLVESFRETAHEDPNYPTDPNNESHSDISKNLNSTNQVTSNRIGTDQAQVTQDCSVENQCLGSIKTTFSSMFTLGKLAVQNIRSN